MSEEQQKTIEKLVRTVKRREKSPDTVTVAITGTKKFRQAMVDLIFETLMDEDLEMPGNGSIHVESTLEGTKE